MASPANDLEHQVENSSLNPVEQAGQTPDQNPSQPERQIENVPSTPEQVSASGQEFQSEQSPSVGIDQEGSGGIGAPGIDNTQSGIHQEIEAILEEDLGEIYTKMDPASQEKFKAEGERVAVTIIDLIHRGKATFKKVFKLIFGWLKIIPGVNKFFISQEAKIKTDRILKEQDKD